MSKKFQNLAGLVVFGIFYKIGCFFDKVGGMCFQIGYQICQKYAISDLLWEVEVL